MRRYNVQVSTKNMPAGARFLRERTVVVRILLTVGNARITRRVKLVENATPFVFCSLLEMVSEKRYQIDVP